jgi:hypothetical protein
LFLSFRANAPLFNQFTVIGNNLAPNETSSLFKDAANSNTAFVEGFASGATLAEIETQIPQFFPPAFNNSTNFIHSPQYQKWSLELQQALGPSTTLSVGYYGHHGIHLLIQNPSANAWGFASFPAGLCTDRLVLPCADPRFSQVTELSSAAISNYHGMVVTFQHRFNEGMLQANYTYSHALDESSSGGLGFSFTSASSTYAQDPNNIRGSYGSAEFDVRHSFNASYVWQLPIRRMLRGHGSASLVDGWEIAGTIFARTGFPYTVLDGAEASHLNANNFYGPIYAVPAAPMGSAISCGAGAAFPPGTHPCQPPQVLADGTTPNPNARFIQSGCETDFNAGNLPGPTGPCGGSLVEFAQGRNHFRGPGYFNTDFSLVKDSKLPKWEKATLRIGFQFFNFFNHPNFGFPDNQIQNQSFGQIFYLATPPTSVLGSVGGDNAPRMIQLKAEVLF